MKDIGLGVLDPYTIIIALITLVLSQILFGNEIPLDTSNAIQLFVSLAIFTGYLYLARSLFRLPVAAIRAWIITFEENHIEYITPRWHGFKGFLWIIRDTILFLLWVPPLLILFLIHVFNFSNADFNIPHPSKRLKKYYENNWLRFFLKFTDRIGIVLITLIATFPYMQRSVQVLGIVGLEVMVFVFMLKGNFSAIIKDNLNKVTQKKLQEKDIVDGEKEENQHSKNEHTETIRRLSSEKIYISHCKTCNKTCAGESEEKLPIFCSLQCRQKWFPSWERDWEIGDGVERQLIEEQRKMGYSDFDSFSQATTQLKEIAEDFLGEKAVWTLLAMIHDLSAWNYTSAYTHYKNSLRDTLSQISQKNDTTKYIYLSIILDENEELVYAVINLLINARYKYPLETYLTPSPLLNHKTLRIRQAAIKFLGENGDLERIYNHLGKKGYYDDEFIIQTLKIYGKESIPYLKKSQKHQLSWIRLGATQALIELGIETKEPDFVIGTFLCPVCGVQDSITIPTGWQIEKVRNSNFFKNIFRHTETKTKCEACKTSLSIKTLLPSSELFRREYKRVATRHRRNAEGNWDIPSDGDWGNSKA
ncbi:MAG: hypothetical protein ACTSXG_01350 [Alphaproteobacteria bacterium]